MIGHGQGVGRRLDEPVAAGAVLGPIAPDDEWVTAGDPRTQSRQCPRHLSLAAADIDNAQARNRPDRRQ